MPRTILRTIIAAVAILCNGGATWGQTGRDCAAPKTPADRAICSDAKLKALDDAVEKSLTETDLAEPILDPETDFRLHQRWDREIERCLKPMNEACALAAFARRSVFLKNLRISLALEPRLALDDARWTALEHSDLTKASIYDLATIHPVLAPATAALMGGEWLFWVDTASDPAARLRVLPDGRWLIGRGSTTHQDSNHDLYIAIDLHDRQLFVAQYQDYFGELYEPFRSMTWASTTGVWPAGLSLRLSPLGGRLWRPEVARVIGLPSTRLRPFPRKAPDCSGVEGKVAQAICTNEDVRNLDQEVDLLWKDLTVLHLISDTDYRNYQRVWSEENSNCASRNSSVEVCLKTLYQERRVFVQSYRIALGLDQSLPGANKVLSIVAKTGADQLKAHELLSIHQIVAPLAASVIGPDWLSWVSASGDGNTVALPGGRWIISKCSNVNPEGKSETYVAIDMLEEQLSIIHVEERAGNPAERKLRWASTASIWPVAASKVLAELGGRAFENSLNRQIGLPGTRMRPIYANLPK